MSSQELYRHYGAICAICQHFIPDPKASGQLEKLMEEMVVNLESDELAVEDMDKKMVYGKCTAPVQDESTGAITHVDAGKIAGQVCDENDNNSLQLFSLKID